MQPKHVLGSMANVITYAESFFCPVGRFDQHFGSDLFFLVQVTTIMARDKREKFAFLKMYSTKLINILQANAKKYNLFRIDGN